MTAVDLARAPWMDADDLPIFEESFARFLDRAAPLEAVERWRRNKIVDRDVWTAAGAAGFLGASVPAEYGGSGGDFRHEVAIAQAIGHRGADDFFVILHNAVILPYLVTFGTEEQKLRWLPRLCSGELVSAIAMTEPGAGSDLRGMRTIARRVGDGYELSGQKTFISNGQLADLIIVAAKTEDGSGSDSISLFVVEPGALGPGFQRGRNLSKLGLDGQDTSELFFDRLAVPTDALLGGVEGQGLRQLMAKLPQERLVIAWQAISMMERALGETIGYVKERRLFGRSLSEFQNTEFKLAEYKTEATIAKVFVNHCTEALMAGELTTEKASMAKYWVSDLLSKIVDGCLQLFGGYGYMAEYPISQMYKDSRIHRIYGGANEVMKLVIARSL